MQPDQERSIVDLDPEDPSQSLDNAGGFSIDELDVSAEPEAEQQADLDAAIAEDSEEEARAADEGDDDDPIPPADREVAEPDRDTGELYGVHLPPAADPDLLDIQSQDDEGRNWLEALETEATEYGPEAEHVIDVVDDTDPDHPGHNKTDTRDRPVADKGSGGPAGL
jgi:hypothetical protein